MTKLDLGVNKETEEKFLFPAKVLKKHLVALGGSGSGKTVFCKGLIEEALMQGLPSLLIDPQGDLASLALPDNEKFKAKVVVYTPTSSRGIPICLNPLKLPPREIEYEDLVSILHPLSESLVKLLGYSIKQDTGKSASTLLYLIFMDSWKKQKAIDTFDNLAKIVQNPPAIVKKQAADFIRSDKDLKLLAKKIKYLTIGSKDLLFQFGVPVNIDMMFKEPQINVIYLNTLESQDDKHFFLFSLATELYNWMLSNPSPDLQALFMIDEIAEYIPAGARKPITKNILKIIFKQARKYGVGCIISTQNPGDIDYKAFAQFGTWSIGRLTTKQDTAKVKNALGAVAGPRIAQVTSELPKLKPGEFLIFCPDVFDDIVSIKTRWLYTKHVTLTEKAVKKIMDPIRPDFEKYMVKKKLKFEEDLEDDEPLEEATRLEGEAKVCTIIKPEIDEDKVMKLVTKRKKKQFLFFGKHVEDISSFKMKLFPVYLATVQVSGMGLLRNKTNEYNLIFDASSGKLLKYRGHDLKTFTGYDKVLSLKQNEIIVLKKLMSEGETTAEELALKLKFTASTVKSNLKKMMQKQIVGAEKIEKRQYWKSLVRLPYNHPEKLHSRDLDIAEVELTAEPEKEKIKPKMIASFIENFFQNTEIMQMARIYYPVYEVKLRSDDKTRVIYVSALSGQEL